MHNSLITRTYHSSKYVEAKILASDPIEKICGSVFKERGHDLVEMPGIKKDELLKIIGDYDGLVVRSATKVTKEILDAGVKLKIIGRAGTGVDNIDVRSATSKGKNFLLLVHLNVINYNNLRNIRYFGCQYSWWKYNFNWRACNVSYSCTGS